MEWESVFSLESCRISFYGEPVLQIWNWPCLQKPSTYNFTLKGSLPEASTSCVNIIKCLQTLTNIEKSKNLQRRKIKGRICNETKNHWKLKNYTKYCKFRSISKMGAWYVNYLRKIFRMFPVGYMIHCMFSIVLMDKSTSLPLGANSWFLRQWWPKVLLGHSSIKKKKDVLETKLLKHLRLKKCYLQYHKHSYLSLD